MVVLPTPPFPATMTSRDAAKKRAGSKNHLPGQGRPGHTGTRPARPVDAVLTFHLARPAVQQQTQHKADVASRLEELRKMRDAYFKQNGSGGQRTR